jgi:argininosuccinate lyase
VGKLVLLGLDQGKELDELSIDEIRSISLDVDEDVFDALSLEKTIASKSAIGGTSPERVGQQLQAARESLEFQL